MHYLFGILGGASKYENDFRPNHIILHLRNTKISGASRQFNLKIFKILIILAWSYILLYLASIQSGFILRCVVKETDHMLFCRLHVISATGLGHGLVCLSAHVTCLQLETLLQPAHWLFQAITYNICTLIISGHYIRLTSALQQDTLQHDVILISG